MWRNKRKSFLSATSLARARICAWAWHEARHQGKSARLGLAIQPVCLGPGLLPMPRAQRCNTKGRHRHMASVHCFGLQADRSLKGASSNRSAKRAHTPANERKFEERSNCLPPSKNQTPCFSRTAHFCRSIERNIMARTHILHLCDNGCSSRRGMKVGNAKKPLPETSAGDPAPVLLTRQTEPLPKARRVGNNSTLFILLSISFHNH